MFENVPDRLLAALREIPESLKGEPRYVYAATSVIAEYLQLMPIGADANRFFDFTEMPGGGAGYEHSVRLLTVGETLFLLRSCSGFSEFCRRFRGRDMRSTFFELFAARSFFHSGFDLYARPEADQKREDFDFQATRDGERINVEVTALTAPSFSIKTVKNALDQKRKQLPDSLPAIIFCVHPESWFGEPDLDFALMHTTYKFFSGSKRVNAVVYVGERHYDSSGDRTVGRLIFLMNVVPNSGARIPIRSLDFLYEHSFSPLLILKDSSTPSVKQILKNSEFFRWVDEGLT